ncbi:MFS transporter [Nocardia sp. NPDC004711]
MNHPAPAQPTDPDPDADATPAPAPPSPARLRRLFVWAPFTAAVPQLAFGITAYFSALQVQTLDPVHKLEKLALVHTVVAVVSIAVQPLVGIMSDRTRTRHGARTPWLLIGAAIGAPALVATGMSQSVPWLLASAVLVHIGFHTLAGPLSAIQPDRIPVDRRGRYSSLFGLGTIAGGMLVPVIGSRFATRIPLGYAVTATLLLAITIAFILRNPDTDNRAAAAEGASTTRSSLKGLWVSPARHPDFFWVFAGRFLLFGGYAMIHTFQLYVLQDYIGLSRDQATNLTPMIALVCAPGFVLAVALSGMVSDRIGRRKPIVLAGGLVVAAAALIPALTATVTGIVVSFAVLSIGFGIFISVDQALATQVLPDQRSGAAKDLGILNIASALPNAIAPALAAAVVGCFGGYAALYVTVAAIGVVGAFAVLPIKVP